MSQNLGELAPAVEDLVQKMRPPPHCLENLSLRCATSCALRAFLFSLDSDSVVLSFCRHPTNSEFLQKRWSPDDVDVMLRDMKASGALGKLLI